MADSAVIQVVINPAWVEAHLSEWLDAVIREAKAEAVESAQRLVMQYLTTAEKWRYDEVREALTRRAAEYRQTPDGSAM